MKKFKLSSIVMLLIGAALLLVEGAFASFGVQTRLEMPYGHTIQMNGISNEIWVDYIIENLFKDNTFMSYCFDESEYVLNGKVVHIPQAGAKGTVVKNRSSFPATTVRRTDTDINYSLDSFTTDPRHVTNTEEAEASYAKMDSVMNEDISSLAEAVGDELLYKWAPTTSATIIRTTGALVATALATSATGTRRALLKEDLKKAQKIMNKLNIPKNDRYALIPTDMFSQLQDDADLKLRDGVTGGELNLKEGVIAKLYGFNLMERSSVLEYDDTATPVPYAPGATGTTTDHLAVLCWQKNAVAKAKGSIDVYANQDDALYYGSVVSTETRMGGRKRRTNGEGVIAIVQTES